MTKSRMQIMKFHLKKKMKNKMVTLACDGTPKYKKGLNIFYFINLHRN